MNTLYLAKGKTQVAKARANAIFKDLIFHISDNELFTSFRSMIESATKIH